MKLSEETIKKHKWLLKELTAIVRELEEMEGLSEATNRQESWAEGEFEVSEDAIEFSERFNKQYRYTLKKLADS